MDMPAETAIVDYCLSLSEHGKYTAVFHSVYSKQFEVCRISFSFAANKWKLPFPISLVFCLGNSGNIRKYLDMETWRHGGMETLRHGEA